MGICQSSDTGAAAASSSTSAQSPSKSTGAKVAEQAPVVSSNSPTVQKDKSEEMVSLVFLFVCELQ